jgi:hypothetical protein
MAAPPVVNLASTAPAPPASVNVSVQGPYEAAIIKALDTFDKVLATIPDADKRQMWDNWLAFWKPFQDISVAVMGKVDTAITGLLK